VAVTVADTGLLVDGQLVPVYSGTVHYWRLERDAWPFILDQVQALGFGMVETYIPWSVHEVAKGEFDFGQVDPRKDVEAFMRLCEERGLWLIVRPGPLINAELTDFGFPERVLLYPRVQARTAVGGVHLDAAWGLHPPHQFPVPSYASETFYEETRGWFAAICPIMARHLAPGGCIVAVQSDNETCYLFHDQPYATDYSDASLALYRRFLSNRYGEKVATLNDAYGERYGSFDEVEPPRDCGIEGASDLPLHLDWVAYKEFQIRWSVARFAEMLRECGIKGVPIFHDVAYQRTSPLDVSRMEAEPAIDWVGMNMYCNKEHYQTVARRMRFLRGATRLPFVPEFGCGLWSHHRQTFEPDEHEFVTLAALMHGLKALNFYMLVERERWQGSPITRHGTYRPDYVPFFEQLGDFLRRYPIWEFTRDCETLLLFNYDLSRHAEMTTTLNVAHADLLGLPPELFDLQPDLGLKHDPRTESEVSSPESWMGQLSQLMTERGVDYDYADTHVDPEVLRRYDLVCLQATEFMDPDDQVPLIDFAESGGRLLVGPDMPSLDPLLRPSNVLRQLIEQPGTVEIGRGSITWAPRERVAAEAERLARPGQFRASHPPAELTVLRRGEQTLVFVANPTAEPVSTGIEFEGTYRFCSVWRDPVTISGTESVSVTLPPYSVRIFEVTAA
jgi:beta-galactosidase